MRRRLLAAMLAAVAVALLLLGFPLALAVRTLLTGAALDELQREAEQVQLLAHQEAAGVADVAVLLAAFARESGTRLTLVDRRAGTSVRIDTGPPPDDAAFFAVTSDLEAAGRGSVGRVHAERMLAVTVPVRGGGLDQVVRASRPDDKLREAVRRAWLAIAAVALTALAVAAGAATWQARRVATPLEQLAGSARRLGEGDFSVRAPRSGLPELDDVAAALDATADRLGALVARSRSLSADASHQLRTPLTALRLQLETLAAGAGSGLDAAALADAVAEADRLEATIDEFVALTRPGAEPEPVEVAAIVAERLPAWQALARSLGRHLELRAAPVPAVRARPAAIGQSLQVLLDNAFEHGAGTVTLSVGPSGGGVRLCVADEGLGMPAGLDLAAPAGGGPGRGLALARALVEAEGGRLSLERRGPHPVVCLLLPGAPTGPASGS